MLKQISFYRKVDPTDEIEAECLQNAFNVLIACVQFDEKNRLEFYEKEGLKLMMIVIQEKVQARHLSLKVLANLVALKGDDLTKKMVVYLITNERCRALKSLAPLLLRPPKGVSSKEKKLMKLKNKEKDVDGPGQVIDITLTKQENIENIAAIFTGLGFLENSCSKFLNFSADFG